MPKVVIIWPSFYLYHVARFRAVHNILGSDLLGIEITDKECDDHTGLWRFTGRGELPIMTIFPGNDICNIPRAVIGRTIINTLEKFKPDAVFVNGYSAQEFRMIINWAKKIGVRCYTFSETKKNDFKRSFLKEWVKRKIVQKLDGALCGGRLHKEYLIELGMPEEKILLGYDAVDNDFFEGRSALARANAHENRSKHGLPAKYFISCSRFVKKKNLDRLITAYDIYRQLVYPEAPLSLVLVGEGPDEPKLRAKIAKERLEGVFFAGSQDPEGLAVRYALASCLILASDTEQWGLVINEAMACGLPVLATKVAGATTELVEEGVNGYSLDPYDTKQISQLMVKIHHMNTDMLEKMGRASQDKVRSYSPEYFADNLIKLISHK